MVRPAVPGAPRRRLHACLTLPALAAGRKAGASLDAPCQFPQRRLRELRLGPTGRWAISRGTGAGVLIRGRATLDQP